MVITAAAAVLERKKTKRKESKMCHACHVARSYLAHLLTELGISFQCRGHGPTLKESAKVGSIVVALVPAEVS